MAISVTIERASPDQLLLDPYNPRLGAKDGTDVPSTQEEILEEMKEWALEELAVSFLENGFWPQEALVVVHEKLYGKPAHVVVEGNRRLAALKLLLKARAGQPASTRWREIAAGATAAQLKRLERERIPYVTAGNRDDVQAYLGFRHVSGIKEWHPAEKARFIAHLIEDSHLTYEQVMRRIGSKTPTVRQNYIAYRLLRHLEDVDDERVDVARVSARFSVLFLSLRAPGVQDYLGIDPQSTPERARKSLSRKQAEHLANFSRWLFGTEEKKAVVEDSRDVDRFGRILEDAAAREYLERTDEPSLETAYRLAGGDEDETATHIERAADEIEEALTSAHRYSKSKKLLRPVRRLAEDIFQLLKLFPQIQTEVLEGNK